MSTQRRTPLYRTHSHGTVVAVLRVVRSHLPAAENLHESKINTMDSFHRSKRMRTASPTTDAGQATSSQLRPPPTLNQALKSTSELGETKHASLSIPRLGGGALLSIPRPPTLPSNPRLGGGALLSIPRPPTLPAATSVSSMPPMQPQEGRTSTNTPFALAPATLPTTPPLPANHTAVGTAVATCMDAEDHTTGSVVKEDAVVDKFVEKATSITYSASDCSSGCNSNRSTEDGGSEDGGSEGSGSEGELGEYDVALTTELFSVGTVISPLAAGALIRGCSSFDEACRMLLDSTADDEEENAGDEESTLLW